MEIDRSRELPLLANRQVLTFFFEGEELQAKEGQSVAGALLVNDHFTFGISHKRQEPRGFYCGSGRCCSCLVHLEGRGNVRACITPIREGMKIRQHKGARE